MVERRFLMVETQKIPDGLSEEIQLAIKARVECWSKVAPSVDKIFSEFDKEAKSYFNGNFYDNTMYQLVYQLIRAELDYLQGRIQEFAKSIQDRNKNEDKKTTTPK